MPKDLWIPKGYELAEGLKINSLLFSGDEWQIYDTVGADNIMLVRPQLAEKWFKYSCIDQSLLTQVMFGIVSYWSFRSHKKYALSPVETGITPNSKVDALAFSSALKESRSIMEEVSFHDAIYIEQYSRLLPVWSITPHVDDEVVLGTWITGGVVISTESFRRLSSLMGWLSPSDLADIVKTADLSIPSDIGIMTKSKSHSREQHGKKTEHIADGSQPISAKLLGAPSDKRVFALAGRPYLEEFFKEHVVDIIFNTEKYQAFGIEFPSAIVLHGPPGCGKTYAVERLVEFIDWPSYSIDSNSVGSPYIHETSKKISGVFDKAIDSAPSVIVIDEMESFLSDRGSAGSSGLHHVEEVAEFLRRIPEAIQNKVLIIAMTNLIDLIDPAILRRGRFDHVIEIGMPSRTEVSELIDSLLSKLPKADNLNLDPLFDLLTGKALSDSAFVIREASRLAAKADKSMIEQEEIDEVMKRILAGQGNKKKSIGFEMDA